MSQFLDEWVWGDTGKTITYTVRVPDGSTPDYSTASAISLVAVCRSPQKNFTLAGTVLSGPLRKFSFPSPCSAATAPAAGARDVYDFHVSYDWDADGAGSGTTKTYWTSMGRLAIKRFP